MLTIHLSHFVKYSVSFYTILWSYYVQVFSQKWVLANRCKSYLPIFFTVITNHVNGFTQANMQVSERLIQGLIIGSHSRPHRETKLSILAKLLCTFQWNHPCFLNTQYTVMIACKNRTESDLQEAWRTIDQDQFRITRIMTQNICTMLYLSLSVQHLISSRFISTSCLNRYKCSVSYYGKMLIWAPTGDLAAVGCVINAAKVSRGW